MNTDNRELISSLKDIAMYLKDIRGVVMRMAPKKTLETDGYLVNEEKKIDKIIDEVQWLSAYVKEKNSYVLSTNEIKYILNVIDSKLNDIRADLKEIR